MSELHRGWGTVLWFRLVFLSGGTKGEGTWNVSVLFLKDTCEPTVISKHFLTFNCSKVPCHCPSVNQYQSRPPPWTPPLWERVGRKGGASLGATWPLDLSPCCSWAAPNPRGVIHPLQALPCHKGIIKPTLEGCPEVRENVCKRRRRCPAHWKCSVTGHCSHHQHRPCGGQAAWLVQQSLVCVCGGSSLTDTEGWVLFIGIPPPPAIPHRLS